jgi:hypothetical protein
MKGLEPPRLSAPDPKSGAATNYATSAFFKRCKYSYFFNIWLTPSSIAIGVNKGDLKIALPAR